MLAVGDRHPELERRGVLGAEHPADYSGGHRSDHDTLGQEAPVSKSSWRHVARSVKNTACEFACVKIAGAFAPQGGRPAMTSTMQVLPACFDVPSIRCRLNE